MLRTIHAAQLEDLSKPEIAGAPAPGEFCATVSYPAELVDSCCNPCR
jgi:hypothetical protein